MLTWSELLSIAAGGLGSVVGYLYRKQVDQMEKLANKLVEIEIRLNVAEANIENTEKRSSMTNEGGRGGRLT